MAQTITCDVGAAHCNGPMQTAALTQLLLTAFPSVFRDPHDGSFAVCMECWHSLTMVVEKWARDPEA